MWEFLNFTSMTFLAAVPAFVSASTISMLLVTDLKFVFLPRWVPVSYTNPVDLVGLVMSVLAGIIITFLR